MPDPRLLDKDELANAMAHLEGMDPGTPMQTAAMDAVLGHMAAQEQQLAVVRRQRDRARDAISVLYVGNKARLADGKVDVDAVINGVLGESL